MHFPKQKSALGHRILKAVPVTVLFLILISPFIRNLVIHSGDRFIVDNIFQFNPTAYFKAFSEGGTFFVGGQHSLPYLSFFPFFAAISFFSLFATPAQAYILTICALYLIGFVSGIKLFQEIGRGQTGEKDNGYIIPALISFVFFSSVSFFMYINNSIFPLLGYFFLPLQLCATLRYLRSGKARYLVLIGTSFLLLTPLNLTYTIINIISLNLIPLILLFKKDTAKQTLARILYVDLAILPAFSIMLLIFISGMSVNSAAFANLYAENFYSNNATFSTTLRQVSDWGFFAEWQKKPEYAYSTFYQNMYVTVLGFLPYFVLFGLYLSKAVTKTRRNLVLCLTTVVLIFFMQGLNNPLYNYLYFHYPAFQIFRNIAKFSGLLLILVFIQLYILVLPYLKSGKKVITYASVGFLLIFSLYNIPFWRNADSFFVGRSVTAIPDYWQQTADYINTQTDQNSKVFLLPAVYIGETYYWNGKPSAMMGNLNDALFERESYRMSELYIGGPEFEQDLNALYVDSTANQRYKTINYNNLDSFLKKYNLNYVVITKDVRNEYQNYGDIYNWISSTSYKKVQSFGQIDIYTDPARLRPAITSGSSVSFTKRDDFAYDVRLSGLTKNTTLTLDEYAQTGWQLDVQGNGSSHGDLISTGHEENNNLNTWNIDLQKVKSLVNQGLAVKNADGSYSLDLRVYYQPRATLEKRIETVVGVTALATLITIYGIGAVRRKKKLS